MIVMIKLEQFGGNNATASGGLIWISVRVG
jgi:hypothetical protein